MTNHDLNPSGRNAHIEQIKQIDQAVSHLPRRERHAAKMKEFDRLGIAETDSYRNATKYVALIPAACLLIGTYRALTYSPNRYPIAFILALVLIAFGLFFSFILLRGMRRDRNRKRSPNGPASHSRSE